MPLSACLEEVNDVSLVPSSHITIAPQSGVSFRLKKGETLVVLDPQGEQVSDLFVFPADDLTDALSSGRSIDYNETTQLTTGHLLYANSGRVLMTITGDTCGRHDFLVTPCNLLMFQRIANDPHLKHPGCFENLAGALSRLDIDPSRITTTFNLFMNVPVDNNGAIRVLTPTSQAGDYINLRAETDLIVGLTACSDEGSNGGTCKPIQYTIV